MSYYSYCALKCEGDDYVYTSALPEMSFLGGTQLTFSCDFYYLEGISGTLFSQEDAVSCDIKDGRVSWKTKNGNDLSSDPLRMPLQKERWNHADIVYAADLLSLYINAVLVASKSLQKETTVSEKPYRFGQNYAGYLRNIRITDEALPQKAIIENSQNPPKEKLPLYIPFDQIEVVDEGKYHQTVICTGLARVVSLITALTFDGSSYSYIDGLRVNPGCADMPAFTLETRIYLRPSSTESVTLLENKANNPSELMRISLLQGQSRLRVQVGAYSYESSDVTLPYYEWITFILLLEPSRIRIYINNTLIKMDTMQVAYARTMPADFYLGDSESCKGEGFTGAIEYLAFYNKALTEHSDYAKTLPADFNLEDSESCNVEEFTGAVEYLDFNNKTLRDVDALNNYIYPYVYTQGIQSLFFFHGEGEEDFMGVGKLLHGGTKISLLEDTDLGSCVPLFIETEGTFSGNELERWEANLVSDICLQSLATSVGLFVPPAALPPVLLQWVADKLITMEAAQDVFCNYDNIKPNQILKLNEEILKQPHFVDIFTTTLGVNRITTIAAANMKANFEFYFLLGASLCAAVIDRVIKKVLNELKPNPPSPDPNPPIPTIGYTVVLKSIQFCNGKTGSLPLRETFDQAQSLPEWRADETDEAIIAYVAKKQTPTLKIEFQYIPALDQKSAEVSIDGTGSLFGDFSFQSVHCTIQKVYETTATLSNFGILIDTSMGIHEDKIIWSYTSLTGMTFLRSTQLTVHVVKKQPIEPWSVTDAKCYPLIESLNMVNKIVSNRTPPVTDLPSFVTAFHSWIRTPEKFNYDSIDKYTKITTCTSMDFDRRNLYAAMKDGLTEVGSLDLSVLLADILAMEGLSCQILGFSSYETTFFENGVEKISSLGLQINSCKILGNKQDDLESIARHYTVGVVDQSATDKTVVYDTLFELDTKDLENLPMTDYLTNIALNPDLFQFSFIGYEWMEVNLQPTITEPIEFISYDNGKAKFVPSERPDFNSYVKEEFNFPKSKACCHRLSYKTIETILINTFNAFIKDDTSNKDKKDQYLKDLCCAFYPAEYIVPMKEVDNKCILDIIIDDLTRYTMKDIKSIKNKTKTAQKLENVLKCLNSASYNLREGFANWNSSIGDFYDPQEYKIFNTIFKTMYFFNQKDELELVTNEKVLKGAKDGHVKDGHVYITNKCDKNIIKAIQNINPEYIKLCVGYKQWEKNGKVFFVSFVYSSNNTFDFIKGLNRSNSIKLQLDDV